MSKIEVNAVEPQCGTTLTLGASGDTVTLGSGASQSGFGRAGSVDWQTSIKTATFTAVSGEGYFCNTSGGAFTINLPSSPSVGDIVAIKDYGSSFATNNLTIGRGGSNLNGDAADNIRNTDNESLTMVYADATKGWLSVEEGTGFIGEQFVVATGGTITTCGNDKIHTFTGPGTFTVSKIANCAANNVVSHLVIAGGGGGKQGAGYGGTGGGGAGGYREVKSPVTPYTASPLDGYPSAPNRVTVTATTFPITVGGGGAAVPSPSAGNRGSNSIFSTITSTGGGSGRANTPYDDSPGGSGGGGRESTAGGSGNTPPVSPPQGNDGGSSSGQQGGGGGGGAGAAGSNAFSTYFGGDGGAGTTSSIKGTPTVRAGGGGGGAQSGGDTSPDPASGGPGGGGAGGAGPGPDGNMTAGGNGTANTGGGAGS